MNKFLFTQILFTFFILLLSAIDILSYFFFEYQISYGLLAFLITYSWHRPLSLVSILGIFFLGIESHIMHESFIAWPLMILPITGSIALIKNYVYPAPIYPVSTLIFASIGSLLFWQKMHQNPIPIPFYTGLTLFGTMVIVWIFSLKYKVSKTGQSLTY